jgi:tetratricopeptide (TPR) repeat protein
MKNMQRGLLKILISTIPLIITAIAPSYSQTFEYRLKTADSLYRAGRYTQSMDHYQEIFKNKQYSPAMLLKMAYVEEALNNVGEAMYYLNLYFLATNDEAALEKMETLAGKYDLTGYQRSDADLIAASFYKNYRDEISLALASLVIFLFTMLFVLRVRRKRKAYGLAVVITLVLVSLFVHVNISELTRQAIITGARTYIMDGPSPGAQLIQIVSDGHRVEVVGKDDVWLKIRWDGNIVFVKQNSLLPLEL